MHIDVSDILRAEDGEHIEAAIDGRPELEAILLTGPLVGTVRLTRTPEGVLATGKIDAEVELECSQCLRTFSHHLQFGMEATFSDHPNEDQFLIDRRGVIDLTEPVRQEIELRLPLSPLCQEDHGGLQ